MTRDYPGDLKNESWIGSAGQVNGIVYVVKHAETRGDCDAGSNVTG